QWWCSTSRCSDYRFFFQAEDGIRGRNVTGVQTCALPIWGAFCPMAGRMCMDQLLVDVTGLPEAAPGDVVTLIGRDGSKELRAEEIGRASGRERVEAGVGGGACERRQGRARRKRRYARSRR